MLLPKRTGFLWFICRNHHRCSKTIKHQMYIALVRPHLEYACAVWDTHVTSDIQKIEMVHHRAARFVVRNYSRVDGTVTNILNELNRSSLQEQRKNSRLAIMNKIHANDVAIPIPEYLQRQTIKSTRQYHPLKFRPMKVSSNVYKYSYFPRTISDWNSLPSSVIDSNTIKGFKTALCSLMFM